MVVRGLAIVTTDGATDDELDHLLIALGQRARSEHCIGGEHRFEGGRAVGGNGREGVRHAADRLLDLRSNPFLRSSSQHATAGLSWS
jgi:hypothetical protein